MMFTSVSVLSLLALPRLVLSQTAHGEGAEGTIMGPVAFLWPDDRVWDASVDNIGPCGSAAGVANRTQFPLTKGSIELTIADPAWNVAVSIAYNNNDPTKQSDFVQVVNNVSTIYPGHQCYAIPDAPSSVASGANATIQLAYWSEDSSFNESFYACADISYVEAAAFTTQVTCFNVTASDFIVASPSSSAAPAAPAAATSAAAAPATTPASSSSTESSSGSLSSGAKAGIAVGSVIGGLAVIGAVAWMLVRRRRAAKRDAEAVAAAAYAPHKEMRDAASMHSGSTARN